jgi:hypothetical protein
VDAGLGQRCGGLYAGWWSRYHKRLLKGNSTRTNQINVQAFVFIEHSASI